MLQRIQTIYLLISSGLISILFFLKLSATKIDNLDVNFYLKGIYLNNEINMQTLPLIVLAILNIIFPILIIFMYKHRIKQIKNSKINVLLNILLIVLILIYANIFSRELFINAVFSIGTIVPIISIITTILAIKAIKKDENLVRSVDRIR